MCGDIITGLCTPMLKCLRHLLSIRPYDMETAYMKNNEQEDLTNMAVKCLHNTINKQPLERFLTVVYSLLYD